MNRFAPAASLALFALLLSPASGAPPARKRAPAPAVAPKATPPAKAATPEQSPFGGALPSPWHVWSDPAGHTVEAEFCSLHGQLVTARNRAGQTFQMALPRLVPADTVFAIDYAKRLRARAFADEYVKTAAHQIDFLIGSTLVAKDQKFNPPASEEQFLRRIYLDAIGRIPTADEAAAYLAETGREKRAKLIDKLLYSPGYTMHMYNWLGDMLRMKETFGKGVPAFTFQDWLKDQLHADRPWDSLVREMLTAEGKLCDNGATGFLLYDAQMPLDGVSNLLTTFLGANVACAQCHNHPLAQWKQRDFYQIAAFFGASDMVDEKVMNSGKKLVKRSELRKNVVLQVASANAFRVADTDQQKLTFPKDYKYSDVAPASTVQPALIAWSKGDPQSLAYKIDTHSPAQLRGEFAKWMTHPDNPRFAPNIANRVWKKVFGLAVQEPVSDLDDLSKASNPQLLAYLAQIVKVGRFDLREFQRVLFNTQTYQRAASDSPDLEQGPYLFPGPLVRRMTAEQVWDSLVVLSVGNEVDNMILRRGDEEKYMSIPGLLTEENFKAALAKMKEAGVTMPSSRKAPKPGKTAKRSRGDSALAGEFEGGTPQLRFDMLLARASELPQPAPETHFLRLFGQSDRLLTDTSTTDGSVPQALMLMNGSAGQLISDPQCAAIALAEARKGPEAKVEALFLAFLGRKPSPAERANAKAALASGLGTRDVAWALANTREFLFVQ